MTRMVPVARTTASARSSSSLPVFCSHMRHTYTHTLSPNLAIDLRLSTTNRDTHTVEIPHANDAGTIVADEQTGEPRGSADLELFGRERRNVPFQPIDDARPHVHASGNVSIQRDAVHKKHAQVIIQQVRRRPVHRSEYVRRRRRWRRTGAVRPRELIAVSLTCTIAHFLSLSLSALLNW